MHDDVIDRLSREGLVPLLDAAAKSGWRPSYWTCLRMAITGKLEAVKIGGRWLTSTEAVQRLLKVSHASQPRRASTAAGEQRATEAERRLLGSLGLAPARTNE